MFTEDNVKKYVICLETLEHGVIVHILYTVLVYVCVCTNAILFFFLFVWLSCSVYFTQVLGADVLQTKEPTKTFDLLKLHIKTVRERYSMLSTSPVRVIIERNLGFEAEHLYRECRHGIENCMFVREPLSSRIGVLTTQELKLAFVTYTNIILRENRMYAREPDNFVDVGKNNTRGMLLDQLSFFGFTFSKQDHVFQKEKFVISGKTSGGKDDLCMSLLIGMWFSLEGRNLLVN